MFQHKSANSQNIIEVQNGVYLNLRAEYQWLADDKLDLQVNWAPYVYNESQKKGVAYNATLGNGFNASVGVLTITGIGSQSGKALTGSYSTQISNLGNVKNVNISFSYENGNAIVDLTKDFNILKIPKPSKYDDNVVFNRAGLNEMIDYFKKYPVRLTTESNDEYGSISVAHGIEDARNIPVHGLGHIPDGMVVKTNLIPNTDNAFDLGREENQWKNIYAKDGIFSNSLEALSLKGLFIGNNTELTGDSININNKFKVDNQGNVQMQGSITGLSSKFMYLYHKGIWDNETGDILLPASPPTDPAPSPGDKIYDEDVSSTNVAKRWHRTLNSNGQDHWKIVTFDGGDSWSDPEYINPKDGKVGGWTNENIREALLSLDDGMYGFEDGKFGIKASALVANLATFGKIDMGVTTDDGNKFVQNSFWAGDNTQLAGGYITFPIPAPFAVTTQFCTAEQQQAIKNGGWRGRLGYIRGNGNGLYDNIEGRQIARGTAGLGLVIYTNATFKDLYPGYDGVYADEVGGKIHLVLSLLMLTDSGLGLMTAAHMNNADKWVFQDQIDGDHEKNPHYYYRWWSGAGESKIENANDYRRGARLWFHEDNGGLYWSWNDGAFFKPWGWSDGRNYPST